MAKSKKKFWGPYEIAKESAKGYKNGVLLEFVETTDAAGKPFTPPTLYVSLASYNAVVSDQAIDLNELRHKRLDPVVEKILSLLLEYNVFIGHGEGISSDLEYVFKTAISSVRRWRSVVEDALWGSPEYMKTMQELHDHFEMARKKALGEEELSPSHEDAPSEA